MMPFADVTVDRYYLSLEDLGIMLIRVREGEEMSVVAIGDIDLSACSGVHVMETSELEMLIVDRKVSAGKEGVTIEFKIGNAAKDAATNPAVTSLEIVDEIGCKTEDSPRAVANMKHELEMDRRMLKDAVRTILSSVQPEDVGGCPVFSARIPAADRSVITDAAESAKSKGGVAAYVSVGETASVVLASGDKRVNCKVILGNVLKEFGGRGGGKPDFSQGGVQDVAVADDVLKALVDAVKKSLI